MTGVARADRVSAEAAREPDRPCPICGATSASRLRLREMMFGTRETFEYLVCGGCGTIRIADVPDDLGRHYPARYHYERLPEDMPVGGPIRRALVGLTVRPQISGSGRMLARVTRRLVQPPPGYRRWRGSFQRWGVRSLGGGVLDVGCGPIPNRLIALRSLGFRRLLGVDPFIDRDIVVEGVPVRKIRIEDVDGSFDLVWFHHSLEHVTDPRASLAAAARLLRRGGQVIVRTPVMGTALWRRYTGEWWELDPPRHLFVFSADALTRMAAAVGLELEEVVQETHFKEFVGSEQYRRDLAMFEPGSWFLDPDASGFSPDEFAVFADDARRANEAGDAGRACFRFRLAG